MKIFLEKEQKHVEVKGNTVSEILTNLEINPTTVIVSKNGNLVIGEEKITSKDNITIFTVVSGG
jgi:sulfur carrier protein ThiS